jgi:hypothetical protein
MTEKFCIRTARKIRKLGATPKNACFYSRFFCTSMLSVFGIMISCRHRRKEVKVIGEEIPRSFRHMLADLKAPDSRITDTGIILTGLPAEDIVPASSRIHSQ